MKKRLLLGLIALFGGWGALPSTLAQDAGKSRASMREANAYGDILMTDDLQQQLKKIRAFRKRYPKSTLSGEITRINCEKLLESDAKSSDLVSAFDDALAVDPDYPNQWPGDFTEIAGILQERRERLADATRYVELALGALRERNVDEAGLAGSFADASMVAADIYLDSGRPALSKARLEEALARGLGDAEGLRQAMLIGLGMACLELGDGKKALDYYVCAASINGPANQRAMTLTRDLYLKQFGALDGIEVLLKQGCQAH